MKRRNFLYATTSALILAPYSAHAEPLPLAPSWERDRKDPRWVQGQVTASGTADAVFGRLQKVDEWPVLFSDIKSMKVLERGADHWRIKLETRTFDCGAHEYHVRFEAPRTARLWIDAPGVTALALMRLADRTTPGTSRIVYSLFIEAHGIAGWFISKDDLRRKQEEMVSRYLSDLERAFGP